MSRPSSDRADPDVRLLRRAARTVAVQTALAVAAVVLVFGAAVLLIDQRQQRQQAETASRSAWLSTDDVRDPPQGVSLIAVSPSGHRQVSPGAPAAVRGLDPTALGDGISDLRREHHELVVYTGRREIGRVSAVYDLTPDQQNQRRLEKALVLAALVGVAGAAGVGTLIGRRAVRPLGAAMALQRRFVADASHELRTPLSVLLLRAQLLRRRLDGTIPARRVADLDRMVMDAKALGDVVNDLLLSFELLHRPQGGEPVRLRALAAEAVESLQPLADERAVELTVEPAIGGADAGGSTEDPMVSGARAALRRALVSLIDNAIAHTPAGGRVRVTIEVLGDRVGLSVIDTGEGLDPAQAHRLIERFSRGTSIGSGRRFGLGLALVDEVARAHGGTLLIDGRPAGGASFTLLLPALSAPTEALR